MYIISCMNVSTQSQLVEKNEKPMMKLYDVHKWLDDMEVLQVVLKI